MSKKLLMNNGGINNRLKVKYITTRPEFMNTFNDDFVYETKTIDNYDGTYTIEVYSDDDFTSIEFGSNCYAITSIEYLAITNKVTSMGSLFYGCEELVSIEGMDKWDTSNVTDMSSMFRRCSKLETLDGLGSWDTSNVTDMKYMFKDCGALVSLKGIENWNVSKVKYMTDMFNSCIKLTTEGLGNISKWTVNLSVSGSNRIFKNCYALTSLDLSGWGFGYQIIETFYCCNNLKSVDLTNCTFRLLSGTTATKTFYACSSLTEIRGMNKFSPNRLDYTFYECKSLTSLDFISSWKGGYITTLEETFKGCTSLTSLDLSNFNTSKVARIGGMFKDCTGLTSLNISSFDTNKVVYTDNMLYNVPTNVDWHYDGTNYANFTLTEEGTGYSGTFPWNE